MAELNAPKLKKIAKISAERVAREDAELQATPMRLDRVGDQKAIAKLLEKNIDGVASLNREFDALLVRNEAKAESQIKKLRAQALKTARSRKPALANMIAQRVKSFEALVQSVDVPSAKRYLVNTPIEIVATQLNLDSFAIVPSNSWAKFKVDLTKTTLYPSVIFRFVWENSTDKYVVINANGYMILNGFCDLWSGGGVFGGDRYSTLKMTPTLELIDWTTEPYLSFGREEILAVDMHTDSGSIWDDADREVKDVFRGYDLLKSLVLVPPRTSVGLVMTVAMHVYAGQNSGRVRADFSTGSYQVGSPAVLITVLS